MKLSIIFISLFMPLMALGEGIWTIHHNKLTCSKHSCDRDVVTHLYFKNEKVHCGATSVPATVFDMDKRGVALGEVIPLSRELHKKNIKNFCREDHSDILTEIYQNLLTSSQGACEKAPTFEDHRLLSALFFLYRDIATEHCKEPTRIKKLKSFLSKPSSKNILEPVIPQGCDPEHIKQKINDALTSIGFNDFTTPIAGRKFYPLQNSIAAGSGASSYFLRAVKNNQGRLDVTVGRPTSTNQKYQKYFHFRTKHEDEVAEKTKKAPHFLGREAHSFGNVEFFESHGPSYDLTDFFALHSHLINANTVMSLGLKMADALQSYHQKNIYHHDIKPKNIVYAPMTDKLYFIDNGEATIIPDGYDDTVPVGEILSGVRQVEDIKDIESEEQYKKMTITKVGSYTPSTASPKFLKEYINGKKIKEETLGTYKEEMKKASYYSLGISIVCMDQQDVICQEGYRMPPKFTQKTFSELSDFKKLIYRLLLNDDDYKKSYNTKNLNDKKNFDLGGPITLDDFIKELTQLLSS